MDRARLRSGNAQGISILFLPGFDELIRNGFLRWPITRPRSELKIASPSVCVHELAAVASATVATATLPYRHHHHRDHHHHHQTARKITWAHKGGQQLRPTRVTQLRPPPPPSSGAFSIQFALPSTRNFLPRPSRCQEYLVSL